MLGEGGESWVDLRRGKERCSHLGVEDARVRLDNADSLVESRDRIESTIGVAQDCGQIEPQLLRVEFRGEVVGQALLLASRDLDIVPRSCQVADDTRALRVKVWCPETAANEIDGYCFGLLVGEGE